MKNKGSRQIFDIWEIEQIDPKRQLEPCEILKNEDAVRSEKKFYRFSLRHFMSNRHLTAKMINGKMCACLAQNEELAG